MAQVMGEALSLSSEDERDRVDDGATGADGDEEDERADPTSSMPCDESKGAE